MTEIYRDSTGKAVAIDIAGATVTAVEFHKDGSVIPATAGSTVQVPYAVTHSDGDFDVVWTYTVGGDTYTRRVTHSVVTPLFVKSDLSFDTILSTLTDPQVVKLEILVRKIIEAYTGQRFGYRDGYVEAWGGGDGYLMISERAVSLESTDLRIANNGFAVRPNSQNTYSDVNIKIPAEEEAYARGYSLLSRGFTKGAKFRIYGVFGWLSVPDDVKEAALILAEEFSCDESMWRDRYIKSIRAADWRFDFADGAYQGTGSLNADQLLDKYRVNRVAII